MGAPGTTPGPWFVGDEDEGVDGIEFIEVHAGHYMTPSFDLVAHIQPAFAGDFLPLDGERRANAHQIAASGAMYDAMAEFVARVDAGEVRSKRTYAKFKAILALARGEPSNV